MATGTRPPIKGFGAWIRDRRRQVALGLRDFALKAEMDPGNLSKYERGVLPPPQDPATLKRLAAALQLEEGSTNYTEFMDLAAASAGRLPPDLVADPRILARMPFLFRTARGKKLTRDQLIALAEQLKTL